MKALKDIDFNTIFIDEGMVSEGIIWGLLKAYVTKLYMLVYQLPALIYDEGKNLIMIERMQRLMKLDPQTYY